MTEAPSSFSDEMQGPSSEWAKFAACKNESSNLFYPPEETKTPERNAMIKDAIRICAGCPVRRECLNYAIAKPEKFGVWGGMTEEERFVKRRRMLNLANVRKKRLKK